jgi:hypothetical protein
MKQLPLFLRPKQALSKAGNMKRRPKAIARPREMVPGPGGVKTWIDAAK